MLDDMSRQHRSLLCLSLTSLALTLSILAFCTSYWCEGTHKVVKPLCLSPVKMKNCSNISQPSSTDSLTPDPNKDLLLVSNGSITLYGKEEPASTQEQQLVNAVHYIWETGEDKYMLRYFHTGFWLSCEEHNEGEKCRSFIELAPGETQGVLWLSVVSEFLYIGLLIMGFLLIWLEVLCDCAHKEMHALKVNAFAAICIVLSGLMGMVAHMMYSTVFQMTVSVGPEDWKPQSWDYGSSFILAWISFSCCMAAAVLTINSYTKTVIELNHQHKTHLEVSHNSRAPAYDDVIQEGRAYSVSNLLQCQDDVLNRKWSGEKEEKVSCVVLIGECGADGCVDCTRELHEMGASEKHCRDYVC